ncbi:MAG: response regulator [Hydrogenophaga sp.]|uniref:response regulator n=1 Tax=Hydrogenophaga intermedia TaxID=65786 RepID=UPI002043AB86|nr:response regulator [Hydrogenophaga intermedia]MCM3565232.1 response regulator [Hydrogenophaga intermedia]
MKALLVDDDEISRLPLAALLGRMQGITEVVEAPDGEQAWALLQQGLRPCLCCCDMFMPQLDGIGLLQRTRQDPLLSGIPFLMISAAADRESVTRAVEAGASGFIVKPYTPQAVQPTIERVMRDGRLRQCEPAAKVRQRLGISQEQLVRITRRWQADITTLLDGLDALEGEGQRTSSLRRLHSASVTLGQLRCAELLRHAIDEGPEDGGGRAALREVLALADSWLAGAA